PNQPVAEVLPEFRGPRPIRPYADPLHPGREIAVAPPTDETVDAGRVTFRHLLTHTSGLPAWSPLYRLGSPQAIMEAALRSDFSYPTGIRVLYSDLGFILLGEAIARLADQSLDAALQELVLEPLGLQATGFPPPASSAAPTEHCVWRRRRLQGEMHDENAAALGGVAGHAGLFGTAADVAALGQLYLDGGKLEDVRLLRGETASEAVREQARFLGERRGLGWMLRSKEGASCGRFFSPRSYGHTGFTGTSLWVDPEVGLVVVLLTNRVYYGRDPAGIAAFRPALHDAVYQSAISGNNGPSRT
nr:class C beta-lactamase-related serine hydrolase [Anaerolineae bacterium]